MAPERLSSVMLEVVENNRRLAHALVKAYRRGSGQLIDRSLSGRFGARGEQLSELITWGVDRVAERAEAAVTSIFGEVSKAVSQMGDWADQVDNPYATLSLQLFRTVNLPGARAARALSGRLAAGVGQWYGADAKKVARPARRPAKRRRTARQQ